MFEEKIESCKTLPVVGDFIEIEIVLKKHEGKGRFKVLSTSEVIDLVKEKYHFIVKDILTFITLTNIREEDRKGIFKFSGHYDVPKDEKWLFENSKVINSVMKGLEEAKNGEFVSLPEIAAKLATKLDTLPEEEQAKLERKINKKISKSTYRRLEIQKKEE